MGILIQACDSTSQFDLSPLFVPLSAAEDLKRLALKRRGEVPSEEDDQEPFLFKLKLKVVNISTASKPPLSLVLISVYTLN